MNHLTLALALLIALIAATPSSGQCTAVNPSFSPETDRVRILVSPSVQSLLTGIQRGIADRNNADCVNRYLNPFPFPEFFIGSVGSPRIRVQMRNDVGIDRTADMIINLATGDAELRLHTHYRLNGTDLPIDWSNPEVVRDSIAHELGHYLRLDDVDCFGYIMGTTIISEFGGMATISPVREIRDEECFQADSGNMTDWEEDEIICQLDPDCNPDAPCGPFCCPIVIDFDGGEFALSAGPVTFDIDANGVAEDLTWVDGDSKDFLLAWDRNGNGVIDDGSELFGSGTPLQNGFRAPHGYAAMLELDGPAHGGNGDGFLSAQDRLFGSLLLWRDSNQNAVSESWELEKVEGSGLIWIDLRFASTNRLDAHGNNIKFVSPALIRKGDRLIETWAADVFFKPLRP